MMQSASILASQRKTTTTLWCFQFSHAPPPNSLHPSTGAFTVTSHLRIEHVPVPEQLLRVGLMGAVWLSIWGLAFLLIQLYTLKPETLNQPPAPPLRLFLSLEVCGSEEGLLVMQCFCRSVLMEQMKT